MKRIYGLAIFAVILLSSIKLFADETPIIKASFYENATFKGHWEISIYKDGKLVADADDNMLDFNNNEERLVGKININDLARLCIFIERKDFFKINKHYSAGGIVADGPTVFMEVNCNGVANKIIFYPNSGDSSDITSQKIAEIWEKLWSYSKVQAPSLTKYM